jgi:hypothetical protein
MKFFFGLILIIILAACQRMQSQQPHAESQDTIIHSENDIPPSSGMIDDSTKAQLEAQRKAIAEQMSKAQLTHFVIRVPDGKFGYTIFIDGTMYIEQKSIPGREGNAGFDTEAQADAVARRVMDKLRIGEMPPTISEEDLVRVGVPAK